MIILVLILFLLASLAQLIYWAGIFARLPNFEQKMPVKKKEEGISVVICYKNEEENLRKNLDRILSQNYRFVDFLLINDHSEDNSSKTVLDFQNIYSTLRHVEMHKPTGLGKKQALRQGILRARYNNIVVSDADCWPASEKWLTIVEQFLHSPYEIVLGYGPYERRPGFLNTFIRFETVYTTIQYFSFAIIGMPYMGVGRNLAYRRELFYSQNGFSAHAHLPSGDDDLFVNGAAQAHNTALMLQADAFVYSSPETTWSGYYHQKRRHLSVGRHYQTKHQWLLGGLSLSHSLHYLLGILLLVSLPEFWPIVLITYSVRMGVVLWVWTGTTRLLREPGILLWVPILDFLYLLYYFLLAPALLTGSQLKKWK